VEQELPLAIAFPAEEIVANETSLSLVYVKPWPEISPELKMAKRAFDIVFSAAIMILGFPVFLVLYLITVYSTKGHAIFKQERMGENEQPFFIYKFRSMHLSAEAAGPQLSSETDPRITKWGRAIRRTRLDELPQFWNVFKGDMSVVGPRPERQHFINKIVEKNPNYRKLHLLKPGVTSMGQVHFGYAENVDQMCIRMLYDLNYIENVNLNTDIKIILKTIKVMIQCKGK
jgi:lipopolysaccharide/colanic/teichoic acid biosynthesis glycosyltransferase